MQFLNFPSDCWGAYKKYVTTITSRIYSIFGSMVAIILSVINSLFIIFCFCFSRNLLRQDEDHSSRPSHLAYNVLTSLSGSSRSLDTGTLDFKTSLEDESHLNCFLSSPFHSTSFQTVSSVRI